MRIKKIILQIENEIDILEEEYDKIQFALAKKQGAIEDLKRFLLKVIQGSTKKPIVSKKNNQ